MGATRPSRCVARRLLGIAALVLILTLTAGHAWADDGDCDPDCTTTTTEATTTTEETTTTTEAATTTTEETTTTTSASTTTTTAKGHTGGGGGTTTTTSTTVPRRTTTTTEETTATTSASTTTVVAGGPPVPPPSDDGASTTASGPATQSSPFRSLFPSRAAWAPPFAGLPSAGATTSTAVVAVEAGHSQLATAGERARASSQGPARYRIGADTGGSAASILTWIVAILLGLGVFAGILRLDRRWSKE